ncbi:glycine cleavage system aminomethyltransferase GcvT [Granulosicoccaceae sp. 1_MG-2023]|nr:glycine cleavage system aminomethyltransferase GcvT [Granulosicoccaceae sp. 1_MG-2023]
MTKQTPLNAAHRALNARMVDFAGWDMPVQYTSLIEEHLAVRRDCGMFDVSHMLAVDISGEQACDYLRVLLANDVARLKAPGKALYSCMLNDKGGVIDDLIVYFVEAQRYRVVVNAGTRDKDLAWMESQGSDFAVTITPRPELAIIAVQGPGARDKAHALLPAELAAAAEALPRFACAEAGDWFVGRTGYTGEDGYEVMLPGAQAAAFWQALLDAGVTPAGLGARDTLRLEAGMNLYGNDMDETITPLAAGLDWTVSLKDESRRFTGRAALEAIIDAGGPDEILVGLVLKDRGVLRAHMPVEAGGEVVGETTSGTFSPTLNRAIAFARIRRGSEGGLSVSVRGKSLPVKQVTPPFVKNGAATFLLR